VTTWQLQEAKNKLSQVVDDALDKGPQIITRHGTEVAVVLSYEDYRRIVASRPRLVDFFRSSPLVGVDLDLSRDSSPIRDEFTLDEPA
jgi:prevent-host-death family protein